MTLNTIIVYLLISVGNFGPTRGGTTVLAVTPSAKACSEARADFSQSISPLRTANGGIDSNFLTCSRAEIVNMSDPIRVGGQQGQR